MLPGCRRLVNFSVQHNIQFPVKPAAFSQLSTPLRATISGSITADDVAESLIIIRLET